MSNAIEVNSVVLLGRGYRHSLLYWSVLGAVVVVFVLATVAYWRGTIRIIEESTGEFLRLQRRPIASG